MGGRPAAQRGGWLLEPRQAAPCKMRGLETARLTGRKLPLEQRKARQEGCWQFELLPCPLLGPLRLARPARRCRFCDFCLVWHLLEAWLAQSARCQRAFASLGARKALCAP